MNALPHLLVLSPLTGGLDAALSERFRVHRYHEAKDPAGLLAAIGPVVRAVVGGGNVGLPDHIARALPALEIVAINGVGYDRVDLGRAREMGYRVAITPNVLTDDVADLAVALTLNMVRRVNEADTFVRSGAWGTRSFGLSRSVGGSKVGIFGLGQIGGAVAARLAAFGTTIAYCARTPKALPYSYYATIQELAAASDVLILTAASNAETRQIVDGPVMEALGSQGILVNVARGALVDQEELFARLRSGRLGAAALDVFEVEPLTDPEAFDVPNLVLTPHVGSATNEARAAMAELVIRNLDAHFAGAVPPGLVQ